eukprot:TRINITY_DN3051_c0_g2_i2.p1 TRINITY_DN3051_c0_g2~~TRINITY_DN3051_c0_g2_i2.p1  ORF type:complete len:1150 (+),score=209.50 TRINITY_DN3051_c0_g2_i2:217-3666(+)
MSQGFSDVFPSFTRTCSPAGSNADATAAQLPGFIRREKSTPSNDGSRLEVVPIASQASRASEFSTSLGSDDSQKGRRSLTLPGGNTPVVMPIPTYRSVDSNDVHGQIGISPMPSPRRQLGPLSGLGRSSVASRMSVDSKYDQQCRRHEKRLVTNPSAVSLAELQSTLMGSTAYGVRRSLDMAPPDIHRIGCSTYYKDEPRIGSPIRRQFTSENDGKSMRSPKRSELGADDSLLDGGGSMLQSERSRGTERGWKAAFRGGGGGGGRNSFLLGVTDTIRKMWSQSHENDEDDQRSTGPYWSGAASRGETIDACATRSLQKIVDKATVFPNVDKLKEEIRQASVYRANKGVNDYLKDTGLFQAITKHERFEQVTLSVIMFSAVWMAVEADYNKAMAMSETHGVFIFMANAFCVFFTAEITIRFLAFKKTVYIFKDSWFVFDFVVAAIMNIETWVVPFLVDQFLKGSEGTAGGDASNALMLRLLRMLRLAKMVRMVKLLRALPELLILLRGIGRAMRSVFFTLCLLFILTYVYAVAFVQLSTGSYIGDTYFSNVPYAMFTLIVRGALVDNISTFLADVMEKSSSGGVIAFLFLIFVLMASLTVLNLLVGVLVEVVSVVAACEKEEMVVAFVRGQMKMICEELDMNGDCLISKEEFMQVLTRHDACEALREVGVDPIDLVDAADFIFIDLMDLHATIHGDGKDGEIDEDEVQIIGKDKQITFSEFMDIIMQYRGSNNATVRDIANCRKFVRTTAVILAGQLMTMRKDTLERLELVEGAVEEMITTTTRLESNQQAMLKNLEELCISLAKLATKAQGSESGSSRRPSRAAIRASRLTEQSSSRRMDRAMTSSCSPGEGLRKFPQRSTPPASEKPSLEGGIGTETRAASLESWTTHVPPPVPTSPLAALIIADSCDEPPPLLADTKASSIRRPESTRLERQAKPGSVSPPLIRAVPRRAASHPAPAPPPVSATPPSPPLPPSEQQGVAANASPTDTLERLPRTISQAAAVTTDAQAQAGHNQELQQRAERLEALLTAGLEELRSLRSALNTGTGAVPTTAACPSSEVVAPAAAPASAPALSASALEAPAGFALTQHSISSHQTSQEGLAEAHRVDRRERPDEETVEVNADLLISSSAASNDSDLMEQTGMTSDPAA